jgi:superfamily I DNA/RNA helicase
LNRKGRLVCVGDENQAIYGFAGADVDSYHKLSEINGASVSLPLSVCYRCARSIVVEAQDIVPQIQYASDAPLGVVKEGTLTDIERGDWVLCRNLKPLVITYLWLMKNRIKSKIRGKDIGEGIVALIKKTGAKTLSGLSHLLDAEQTKMFRKLKERGVKHPLLHPKMELFFQRRDVIECLSYEVSSVSELIRLIEGIFTDDVKGIILSTIHKSKGLENDRVFFLCPELIPSRFATQPWQYEQEQNLKYVAITRAKHELIYVTGSQFKEDINKTIKL